MRIILNIALIISILFLPWWVGALIALYACFILVGFYEIIFYGILVDSLYGTRFGYHGFSFVATVFSVCIFYFLSFVREKLAW